MACSVPAGPFAFLHVYPSLIVPLVGVADQAKETIKDIREVPNQLNCGFSSFLFRVYSTLTTSSLRLTVFQLERLNVQAIHRPDAPASPTPLASGDATALSHFSDTIAVEPGLVSVFKRVHFYTGLSYNPPELLHRSDLLMHPFDIPGDR